MSTLSKPDLQTKCNVLYDALKDGDDVDVNNTELCNELQRLSSWLPRKMEALDVLNYIATGRYSSVFPNVEIGLRIMLTLPVSVATGERSFPKLKLIKNYLRSVMAQLRLNDLSMISIENDLCCKIDYQSVIKEFAKVKARKVRFK